MQYCIFVVTSDFKLLCSANVDLYKLVVKELSQTLERQFSGNIESRAAGMVINTMGWIEGVGYEVSRMLLELYSLCWLTINCFYFSL